MGRKKITPVDSLHHCDSQRGAVVWHSHWPRKSGRLWCCNPGPGFILMTMLTLTTGSAFIMWLGEQITDRGIGTACRF